MMLSNVYAEFLSAAVNYLGTLSFVHRNRISALSEAAVALFLAPQRLTRALQPS